MTGLFPLASLKRMICDADGRPTERNITTASCTAVDALVWKGEYGATLSYIITPFKPHTWTNCIESCVHRNGNISLLEKNCHPNYASRNRDFCNQMSPHERRNEAGATRWIRYCQRINYIKAIIIIRNLKNKSIFKSTYMAVWILLFIVYILCLDCDFPGNEGV